MPSKYQFAIPGLTNRAGAATLCPSLVASVAQLVEQLTLNQLVLGSSPSRGTNSDSSPFRIRLALLILAR